MNFLVVTKSTAFLIGPIANLLGYVMDWIFQFCAWLAGLFTGGAGNISYANIIGISIILFTVIVRLLMMPMNIKQQRFSKLNNIMAPEIQAVTKKYKNKKDQESMLKQQEETRAIYDKYGSSPTGGCLQLIIQMPIMFALYRVIINIPAYVPKLKEFYMNIVNVLQNIPGYSANEALLELAKKQTYAGVTNADALANADQVIDVMYNFDASEWTQFQEIFNNADLTNAINTNLPFIDRMNDFFGIPLAATPGFTFPIILIPILAGVFQFLSTKMMPQPQTDPDNPTAKTMQTMNLVMPLISVFFCFTVPAGLGLYWAAGSLVQLIMQLFINRYFSHVDVEVLISQNLEKQNKKRAKQGLPPKKLETIKQQTVKNLQNAAVDEDAEKAKAEKREEQIKKSTEYYQSNPSAKPGSLAAKAGMVKKYNERTNGKK